MKSLSVVRSQSWLSWFLRGTLIFLFLILFAKLFEVQVIKGKYYQNLSQENRIRHVVIPAPRGRILARNGEELATNVEIKKRVVFASDGSFKVTEDLTNAKPEEFIADYKRVYPLKDKFSHALGYLSQVSPDEVGKINPGCPEKGPRTPDALVGKTGLEQSYECSLLGTPGEELVEVSAAGNEIRILGRREPIPGKDLKTTIDYGLQFALASAMDGKKGAAIVTDTGGQILAFYSYPTFDPNLLIDKNNSQEISNLLKDPGLPFFDRVISGTYHPGSVFKPIVAVSALQEGTIDKSFHYSDPGIITVNNYSYTNWYFTEHGRTEGSIDLVRAIARSTDTFFYTIGQMTGPDAIAKWADRFGLSTRTGIDIPGEVSGLIPTPEWKKATRNESWFLGNTYHMSIGQGDVSVTPIEINNYISGIAAGGRICEPRFDLNDTPNCRNVSVSQNNLSLIKDGMKAACTQGGTAYTFFDFSQKHDGMDVACKTGTAEVGTDGTPHAWFTFTAPAENPKIVSTVLVEKGGEGSSVAGPIARKIADYYFASQSN
jgi:penicillin-binding protein 2